MVVFYISVVVFSSRGFWEKPLVVSWNLEFFWSWKPRVGALTLCFTRILLLGIFSLKPFAQFKVLWFGEATAVPSEHGGEFLSPPQMLKEKAGRISKCLIFI